MKRWEIYLEIFMDLLIMAAVVFFAIFMLPAILAFLWPFVVGIIIAVLANPLRRFLERKIKVPKTFGSAIIIVVALSLIITVFYIITAQLIHQLSGLFNELPEIYKKIEGTLEYLGDWIQKESQRHELLSGFANQFENISNSIGDMIGNWIQNAGSGEGIRYAGIFAKGLSSGLLGIIVMILAAYFFMVQSDSFSDYMQYKAPVFIKEKYYMIKENIVFAIGGYIKGQVKIMLMIFVILLVGFLLMRAPYAFLLALLICLLDVLPILGTGTAIIPWAVVKIVDGDVRSTVFLIVIYLVCLISRQVVQPKVLGDSVGLEPLPMLFLMYVGLKFGGFAGFIFVTILGILALNIYKMGLLNPFFERIKRRMDLLRELD